MTGIFADKNIAALNGMNQMAGGWVNGHWVQIAYQLASACFVTVYSGGMTLLLCSSSQTLERH
jgi:Amt family ammonium transporter